VTAAEIEATTAEDVKTILREFVNESSRALVLLHQQSEQWWMGEGPGDAGKAASDADFKAAAKEGGGRRRRGDAAADGAVDGSGGDRMQLEASGRAAVEAASGAKADAAFVKMEEDLQNYHQQQQQQQQQQPAQSSCARSSSDDRSGGSTEGSVYLYYGSTDLPEGLAAGSPEARIWALVRTACALGWIGALGWVGPVLGCASGGCC